MGLKSVLINLPITSKNRILVAFILLLGTAATFAGCATATHFPDNPVTAKDYYLRGIHYQKTNVCDKAILEYTQAIARDPNYIEAYNLRSLCSSAVGKDEESIADLTQLIRLQPKETSYYSRRAGTYMSLGNIDGALADCDTAINLTPDNYEIYKMKAGILFTSARYADAIPVYRDALQKATSEAGAITKAVVFTVLFGGILDPVGKGQGARNEARVMLRLRKQMTERIQLCEALAKPGSPTETTHPITKGMPKIDVLQVVLNTDKIVFEEDHFMLFPEDPLDVLLVTCSRTGSFENGMIRVFLFKDDRLILEKQVPMKDVFPVPGMSTKGSIHANLFGKSQDTVLQALRTTDTVIYNDERQIITVTEWTKSANGKGLRIFYFKDNKLTSQVHPLRLW